MRKRLIVAVFITFLSVSTAFAGHTNSGSGFWCGCTPVEGVCPCCGLIGLTAEPEQDNETVTQNTVATGEQEASLEWDFALTVVLWWFRLTD